MGKKTRKPRNSLTIYSLKEEIEAPDDAIKPNSDLNHDTLKIGGVDAEFYVQPARSRLPKWSRLFKEAVNLKKFGIGSSNAAAVLIVPAADRLFALTFGWGRHVLHQGVWEERFGLKVALNAIDPKSIRSIDRQSFESMGRQVQEQATRPAEATDFGLDIETDMLRAVTGTPVNPTIGLRVTGKDSLVANVEFGLDGIPDYLAACDKLAKDTTYKKNYPWVDHIAEVTDAKLRDRLDDKLVQRVREENFDRLWLAVPERIDWGQVDGFKFCENKKVDTAPDLQFPDLLAQLRKPKEVTVQQLKGKRAYCHGHDQEYPLFKWSAYSCICFEVDEGESTYLLSGGKWYRVASSFVEEVNDFVKAVPSSTLTLPDSDDVSEGEYNKKVAASDPKFFTLLDAKNISHGGGHSKVEIADLWTSDRHLVYVKKYGGSSVLSHLFAQASVAGELLFVDADFRAKANKKLPKAKQLPDGFSRSDYEIVLAIITWSKKKLTLPFFSRVNLRAAVRRLTGFGYKVTLLPVAGPRPK